LKLRAQLVIASSTAEKNAANSPNKTSTLITTGSDSPAPPKSDVLSPVDADDFQGHLIALDDDNR